MIMTEDEICFRFKRNGCRRRHIKILAELNAVEIPVIEEILSSKGLIKAKEEEYHDKEGSIPCTVGGVCSDCKSIDDPDG